MTAAPCAEQRDQQHQTRGLLGIAREVDEQLSEVDHADTTGLGILVWLHKTAEQAGGAICLLGGPPQFRRVLELTGLTQLFELRDQLTEAKSFLGCV